MTARALLARWRRARRTGRDLDYAAYAALVVGGTLFLAAMTGAIGPSIDALAAARTADGATSNSAHAASAAGATY